MLKRLFYWFFNLGVTPALAKDHTVKENIDRYWGRGPAYAEHGGMTENNALINIMEISGAPRSAALEMLRTGQVPSQYSQDRSTMRDANGNRRFPGSSAYAPGGGPGGSTTTPTSTPTGGSNMSYNYGGGGSTYTPPKTSGGGGTTLSVQQAIASLDQDALRESLSRFGDRNGQYASAESKGNTAQFASLVNKLAQQILSGQKSGQAAVAEIVRATGWGPIRATEMLAAAIQKGGGSGGAGVVGSPSGAPAVPAFANIVPGEQQGLSDIVRSRAIGSGITPGFRPLLEQRYAQAQLPFLVNELTATSPHPTNSASPAAFRQYLDSISGNTSLRLGDTLGQAGNFLGQNFGGNTLRSNAQDALRRALQGPEGSVGSELFNPILGQIGQGLGRNFGIDLGPTMEETLRNQLSLTPGRFTAAEDFIGGLKKMGVLDFLNRRF